MHLIENNLKIGYFNSTYVKSGCIELQVVPLKTVIWRMQINIAVDPSRPLGERGTLSGPTQQVQPEVKKRHTTRKDNSKQKTYETNYI